MRAINQFIKLEQDELEKSLERVTTELEGHLAKLQKAKDQLGTVASVKGLEIRGREISKLNSYTLDRIKSVCEALQSKAESVKDQFKEINERFVESLKTFEEGGLYNPAAVEATKVRLLTSNKQANRAVSVFERKVADLETSETEQVNAAMEAFESMLPPHREDLTLLEDLGPSAETLAPPEADPGLAGGPAAEPRGAACAGEYAIAGFVARAAGAGPSWAAADVGGADLDEFIVFLSRDLALARACREAAGAEGRGRRGR